jgi:zinc protease
LQLGADGVTAAELERAVVQTEAQFIYRLQTIGGFGGKGDQLNAYNTFTGNPGYFDRDRQRYIDVRGAGVAAAVTRWLVKTPSVSLSVVPAGKRELALPGAVEVKAS